MWRECCHPAGRCLFLGRWAPAAADMELDAPTEETAFISEDVLAMIKEVRHAVSNSCPGSCALICLLLRLWPAVD